jgi:primosomal protein N' (replication factor Y)
MSNTLFAEILLPLHLPGFFTYRVPESLSSEVAPGKRVVIQLGKKKLYTGIIRKIHENPPDVKQIKYIQSVLDDQPLVTEQQMGFWDWVADYYLCEPGDVMQAALPSALKLKSETKVAFHPGFDGESIQLNEKELQIMEALFHQKEMTLDEIAGITDQQKVWPLVKGLIEKGVLITTEEVAERYKPKLINTWRLANEYHDEEKLGILFDKLSSRAFKQLEVLMTFVRLAGDEISTARIEQTLLLKESKAGSTILKGLEEKGVLIKETIEASRFGSTPAKAFAESIELSTEQQNALSAINESFAEDKPVLLHGVTGSGKTEIYIRLIQKMIDKGKQTLFLLPEIALTSQIINRLKYYFGDKVMVYHSRFNEMERAEVWQRAAAFSGADNDPFILLGARSAIFLPLAKPGLIVVDEEHDPSFKQTDTAPRYNARDTAVVLAKMFNTKLIMGSATPAVESYYNTLSGKYSLVELLKRYGGAPMPEILVADLNKERKQRLIKGHFSSLLIQKMEEALENKEQVILFQNRRGFSLRLFCTQCGWTPECPNCDVTLTYHEYIRKIKCHYCGHQQAIPSACPTCKSHEIKMAGFGTERIENEIPDLFPKARVSRMDLETTRAKNAYAKLFNSFENKEIDILVGTQMVSKGLDFDNVGVVGIMNADNMINFPDFRSFERSFTQIMQVSGRAGRKKRRGRVVIQSGNPYHDVIRFAIDHDYKAMFNSQITERRQFHYPPYNRLIKITIRGRDRQTVHKAAGQLAFALHSKLGKQVLGPEYPLVSRIKNQFLKQILIKIPKSQSLKSTKSFIRESIKSMETDREFRQVRVIPDVDPS